MRKHAWPNQPDTSHPKNTTDRRPKVLNALPF